MRIVLDRSGGLGGVRRSARVVPGALGAPDEGRVRQAVERAGFFALPRELLASRPEPDRFCYRLEIEDGGRKASVRFDEGAASEALLELVDLVQELAGG